MKRLIMLNTLVALCLGCFISSGEAFAVQEKKWPDAISSAIEYLQDYSHPDSKGDFNPEICTSLLSFVLDSPDSQKILFNSGDKANPSAFYYFDINRDLEDILQYGFNPQISSVLLRPSSHRLSYWTEVDGKRQELPKLWEFLSDLSSPVVTRGVQHIEITPDTNSGTYFSYDMDRAIILYKYQGKKVMISLSRQKDKSEVGKKGLILGPDENWDYVYTGEKGVNKTGLGWVRSHIYQSSNITIFVENSVTGAPTQCAIFNWIKAGWAGMNMVKSEHIYNGIIRFATDFKTILENRALPAPEELAPQLARFENMTTNELRNRTRLYFERMEDKYAGSKKQLSKLLSNPDYLNDLQRKEMVSMLIREYTKVLVGKQPSEKADYLLGRLGKADRQAEKLVQ